MSNFTVSHTDLNSLQLFKLVKAWEDPCLGKVFCFGVKICSGPKCFSGEEDQQLFSVSQRDLGLPEKSQTCSWDLWAKTGVSRPFIDHFDIIFAKLCSASARTCGEAMPRPRDRVWGCMLLAVCKWLLLGFYIHEACSWCFSCTCDDARTLGPVALAHPGAHMLFSSSVQHPLCTKPHQAEPCCAIQTAFV